jgi:hypothetical protein
MYVCPPAINASELWVQIRQCLYDDCELAIKLLNRENTGAYRNRTWADKTDSEPELLVEDKLDEKRKKQAIIARKHYTSCCTMCEDENEGGVSGSRVMDSMGTALAFNFIFFLAFPVVVLFFRFSEIREKSAEGKKTMAEFATMTYRFCLALFNFTAFDLIRYFSNGTGIFSNVIETEIISIWAISIILVFFYSMGRQYYGVNEFSFGYIMKCTMIDDE